MEGLGKLEGFVVGGCCEVEGFGTVGVGFESADAVGDDRVGEEVLGFWLALCWWVVWLMEG